VVPGDGYSLSEGRPGKCHIRSVTASYSFPGELWHYPEEPAWHFITLRAGDEVELELQRGG
jgi:hypothetical protein